MATSGAMNTSNQFIKYTITITQNSQSIENNTSNVTVKVRFYRTNTGYKSWGTGTVYCKINGTTYTAGVVPSQEITEHGIVLFTKTLNIGHNTDGSKNLTCSAWISHDVVTSSEQSYTQTLTTIPRKSSLSVGNGTLGTAQTLTVTKQASGFTHTIVATCGSASVTICTKSSSTSISFTPPLTWASQNTTGTSLSVKYTITTYNGNTSIGSNSYTKTCSIPSSVKPSCSLAVSDAMGYESKYGGYLKGLSKYKVVVTPTLAYGSEIASYYVKANFTGYNKASVTTGVLISSGNETINAEVKDKRGRIGTALVTKTVLDYEHPKIHSLTVIRCDSDGKENDQGEYAKITFSGSVTSLNAKNTAKYKLEYKKSSDSTFTVVELSEHNNVYSVSDDYIFAANSSSSYDIRLTITDDFCSVTKTTSVSTGFTIINFLKSGLGIAFGKVAELTNVLDIGFQTRFAGGILQPVLANGTDLDTVMIPNTYTCNAATTSGYVNCPITSATSFVLEVMSAGDAGQIMQRITTCTKAEPVVYERFYYSTSWGEWVRVSDFGNKLLWSGVYYMSGSQTANLSEHISEQPNGIVLVFSAYENGTAQNKDFATFFVPKGINTLINNDADIPQIGYNQVFTMNTADFSYIGSKKIHIFSNYISGNADNEKTGTKNGVTFANNHWVLRYVIGV